MGNPEDTAITLPCVTNRDLAGLRAGEDMEMVTWGQGSS